jgi:hypothetical protein
VLALDVWEHAFYLDFHNMKQDYVRVFLEKLVNWSFVAENLRFVSLAVSLSLRRSSPVHRTHKNAHTFARIIFLEHATGNRRSQPTGALL